MCVQEGTVMFPHPNLHTNPTMLGNICFVSCFTQVQLRESQVSTMGIVNNLGIIYVSTNTLRAPLQITLGDLTHRVIADFAV